ncbi:hypothetical protein X798_03970 [Onchocerca flexuosa]|uniref:Metallo-beta-lactamase domain-containing protein 1 n=1 Tax=Onchocerca flexuosa TaxID=387005 RepID=A0A238BUL8_9BILA|nr:hypothetical protein X798_03970 [Onchocerca flexuosa]
MPSIISPLLAVLSLLIIRSVVLEENHRDRLKLLESLNDSSVNWLHDFVRRGKGSVSKLPFEEIFIGQSDSDAISIPTVTSTWNEIAEANANIVQIGGDFNMAIGSGSKALSISSDAPKKSTKSRIILSATTMPSSPTATFTSRIVTTKTEANSSQLKNVSEKMEFDFKRLAWLLQQAIDRRKTKKNQVTKDNEMKQNIRLKNDSLLGEKIRSSFQQHTFSVSDLRPIQLFYHHVNPDRRSESNDAISRNLETKEAKKMYENGNHFAGNEALKRSNRYPHRILGPILITQRKKENYMVPSQAALSASETHANDDPMIYIIREGSIVQSKENDYEFVSSITLIIDGGEKILVDTGLATDINGRAWILQRLSELGAPPPSINYVITTHGHPDHSGNTNHFPDALHYAGKFIHFGTHFNFSRIPEDNVKKLTKNVYLLKTPGHASDDISVLINNTSFFGTVIVSGDVFIRKEDMKYSTIWKQLTVNETQQQESRKRLLCLADCIIPGHGPLFRVTSNKKRELNCPGNY